MVMEEIVHPFGRRARQLARINPDYCTGCGWCAMFCVVKCIHQQPSGVYRVDEPRCIGCRSCKVNCFYDAVTILPPEEKA